ncbi:hypothetical protein N431DRAFT_322571 [Stipitochalara longipes BDJ]|nr:hypothetical protein N431DRAFT_322571 [Stipitochalara longipes BDJ]
MGDKSRYHICVYIFSIICLVPIAIVTAAPVPNYIATIFEEKTENGDSRANCTKASWTAIVLFYLTNYMSHAVTVKTLPGESKTTVLATYMLAFLFPYSGLSRALEGIFRAGNLSHNPLNMAALSGALCIVVRGRDWEPALEANKQELGTGEPLAGYRDKMNEIRLGKPLFDLYITLTGPLTRREAATKCIFPKWEVEALEYEDSLRYIPQSGPMSREVHGLIKLPKGYTIAHLPSNAIVIPNIDTESVQDSEKVDIADVNLGADRNVAKSLISIIQTLYAAFTLYQSRGQQYQLFGYSASSITIIPYLIMSIMNFIANIATPSYASLFLVSSPELLEARQRGGCFEGTIGRVTRYKNAALETFGAGRWTLAQSFYASFIVLVLMGGIVFAIVGGLTKFKSGSQSTTVQKLFTMWWLAEGVIMGFYTTLGWFGISMLSGMRLDTNKSKRFMQTYFSVLVGAFILQFTPAIGGMIVVGQMLAEYGSCVGVD